MREKLSTYSKDKISKTKKHVVSANYIQSIMGDFRGNTII